MSDNKKEDYYAGLDIGGGSLGYAVTDVHYNLQRACGKTMHGVRLFQSAETAKERRFSRGRRRRLQRRKARIKILREYFKNDIDAIDPGFFLRLDESKYTQEDKLDMDGNVPKLPYSLFADESFTDKKYHTDYPTIYHLLSYLRTTSDENVDPRLVYLGIANMMKHRGHALLKGDIKEVTEFEPVFRAAIEIIQNEELGFESLTLTDEMIKEAKDIITGKTKTDDGYIMKLNDKQKALIKVLGYKTSTEKAIMKLMLGANVQLSTVFQDDSLADLDKISLNSDAEILEDTLSSELGERYTVIEALKAIYDWSVLEKVLNGKKSISTAKMASYKKHETDLRNLRHIIKTYAPDICKEMFSTAYKKGKKNIIYNYEAYIHGPHTIGSGKDAKVVPEEFYKYTKSILEEISATKSVTNKDNEIIMDIIADIDEKTFLPKQRCAENAIIPYQLYLFELDGIFENLKNRVSVLRDHGDEIRKIFISRIPYYVGALNGVAKNGTEDDLDRTNWLVKKENADGIAIHPWNVLDYIDEEKTAENFIRRMTKACTYLPDQEVLPKYSLLYSEFEVLNEINPLKLDGSLLSVEQKTDIINDLFKKHRSVTFDRLRKYMIEKGWATKNTIITGIDSRIKSSLTAYHDFAEKLPGSKFSEAEKEFIILTVSLFQGNPHLIANRLRKEIPAITDTECKIIGNLGYKGWGSLSKKLLTGIVAGGPDLEEDEMSIIERLRSTNENLQQILSYKYDYAQKITDANAQNQEKLSPQKLLDNMNLSPAVIRPIKQTIAVMKEIREIKGYDPKKIFIEMPRETQDSKRTKSRRTQISELYKSITKNRGKKGAYIYTPDEISAMEKELEMTSNYELRKDRVYLYFMQLGHCVYTGARIDKTQIFDSSMWDIDHIYPQSIIFDDGLDNKVLVDRRKNQIDKQDRYPIPEDIRSSQHSSWQRLADEKLISKEKYNRLVRSTELTTEEMAGFINRQLVETRQSTKAVATILQAMFPNTEIVYVKANLVSKFRKEYEFAKIRELNEFHHAKDAYLNIVVGNTYSVKFGKSPYNFVKEKKRNKKKYSVKVKAIFNGNYDVTRGDETAWKHGDDGTIKTVRKMMSRNDILLSFRQYEGDGAFYNATIKKKGLGKFPQKTSDHRLSNIEKYGGYDSATTAYLVLAQHTVNGSNTVKTIESIPVIAKEKIKSNADIEDYLKSIGLQNPKALLKLPLNTIFEKNGYRYTITGKTNNNLVAHNVTPLILSDEESKIIRQILRVLRLASDDPKKSVSDEDIEKIGLTSDQLLTLYNTFLRKLETTKFCTMFSPAIKNMKKWREQFKDLSMNDQCIVLNEILHLFQTPCKTANITLLTNGATKSTKIQNLSKTISKEDELYVVNQSPTGLKEQKVNISKL